MIEIVIGIALLFAILGAIRWMTGTEPAILLRVGRMAAAGLLAFAAILLILRGKIYIAGPAMLVALGLVRGWFATPAGDKRAQGPQSSQMSAAEAYEILGLAPGATRQQIKAAHRRLLAKIHPDHGGSDYLAMKINQARDFLLKDSK